MKFKWNARKVIILTILLLIGCDISFLFAAEMSTDTNDLQQQQQLEQIRQFQQQANIHSTVSPSAVPPAAMPDSSKYQAMGEQRSAEQLAMQGQASQYNPQRDVAKQIEQAQQFQQQASTIPSSTGSVPPRTQLAMQEPLQQPVSQPPPQQLALVDPPQSVPPQAFAPNQVVVMPPPAVNASVVLAPPPAQFNQPPAQVAPQPPMPAPAMMEPNQANNAAAAPTPPPEGTLTEAEVRNQAFNAVVQNQLPMSPEQIQRLRQLFNQSQFAAASTPGTPPRPTATSQFVNLAPGSTPPVIRLAQGFVTSLVFIDSTGAPWPIDSYDIGNPNAFNIQWNKSDNTLMIQSTTLYTYGNLAVRLQGLNTPVMLTLIPGQKAVDYRVDLRIQGMGPNAVAIPLTGLPNNPNPELLEVLEGVPPPGSSSAIVSGCGGVEVWIRKDQMYVRTRYTILSPGWIATMSSADGMKAYQMAKAPLLLMSENGKVVQVKVEGL